jgi:hypothetical protein
MKKELDKQCFDKNHILFILGLLLPLSLLIFSSLVYGIFAFKRFRKDTIRTISLFGHIYKEFKDQYPHFDIVKMIGKLTIILIINAEANTFNISSILITLLLLFYLVLIMYFHPFFYYKAHD